MDAELIHVDQYGEAVGATAPTVAYQVNMDDPGAANFIEGLRAQAPARPAPAVPTPSEPVKATETAHKPRKR